jgi:allophanate hydrolase subunit 2
LGSRSTDVLSRIGPPVLRPGVRLPIAEEAVGFPNVDLAPQRSLTGEVTLSILPGPRDDWFASDALVILCSTLYEVTSESNRIGARLDGLALPRALHAELPPEGVMRGALQVPPDGRPILFLVDHPVTGGYPVIAVVCDDDLDRTAQLRPGERVRFRLARPGSPHR